MSDREASVILLIAETPPKCDCADHDEDCDDIEDKVGCWLYDPGRRAASLMQTQPSRTPRQAARQDEPESEEQHDHQRTTGRD